MSVLKTCTKCGEEKPFSAFRVRKDRPVGYYACCKKCEVALYNRTAEEQREYRKQNHEVCLASEKKWYLANRDTHRKGVNKWHNAHPAKINANNAKRRAKKLQATPAWANEFFIEEVYDLAQRRTKATGIRWEVDHIVPLQSKIVSGLHNEFNLQVIPKKDNASKSNKYWPDMPGA